MPIMAMVLPTGRGTGKTWESMSATKDNPAPTSKVAGMVLRWTEDPVNALAICGATIPTKPRGPQNAVTAPAIRQLPIIEIFLIREGFAPAMVVYSSPKSARSSPRLLTRANTKPMMRAQAMMAIPEGPLPMKLPTDQL